MKKFLLLFVVLVLNIGLWATTQTVTYRYPVYNTPGDPASGIASWTTDSAVATVVEDATTTLNAGWYVVTGTDVQTNTLTCTGAVNLILADGATLTVIGGGYNAGITVSGNGNSLTIYAQSTGITQMGTLNANGSFYGAGIGGGYGAIGSNITINGGTVIANGGLLAAGIGGGEFGNGSNIIINGGTVTAYGEDYSAGIGGGQNGNGSDIIINGGSVTATSKAYGAGIGGGNGGGGSNITINGGSVTANGGNCGAGIGGGNGGSGSNISINGGSVTANGGALGDGIGGGNGGGGSNITVATTLLVRADGNNPPTTVITNTGSDLAGSLSDRCYVTIKTPTPAIVSANVNDETMGSVTGAGEYLIGDQVSLTAIPTAHHHFVNWDNGSTDNPLTFIVDMDSTVTANFAIDQHEVTTAVNDTALGSVTGAGTYDYGTTVTLTAIPVAHAEFTGWSNGETANPLNITLTSDTTVTANFILRSSVDDTEADSYVAYAGYNEIVVTGAADHTVAVYDMNGRLVKAIENAADIERINVNVAGVYVIRVSNMTAARVVVK
ncbi:MAG: T9SS type A sorting domain-containing protein [Paludibacteraceae bacterium]|nr:T9SS type A sorting domain-containing protein [Paludibacteraceae bacterium]